LWVVVLTYRIFSSFAQFATRICRAKLSRRAARQESDMVAGITARNHANRVCQGGPYGHY